MFYSDFTRAGRNCCEDFDSYLRTSKQKRFRRQKVLARNMLLKLFVKTLRDTGTKKCHEIEPLS
jgi:hypothetical protein